MNKLLFLLLLLLVTTVFCCCCFIVAADDRLSSIIDVLDEIDLSINNESTIVPASENSTTRAPWNDYGEGIFKKPSLGGLIGGVLGLLGFCFVGAYLRKSQAVRNADTHR